MDKAFKQLFFKWMSGTQKDDVFEASLTSPQAAHVGNLPWGLLFIATGIALYFSVPFEGSSGLTALMLIGLTVLWAFSDKQHQLHILLSLCLLVLFGYGLALFRTHAVKTPLLPQASHSYSLTMMIEQAVPVVRNRMRYTGKVLSLSGRSVKPPKRIRLSAPDQGPRFVYGDVVCARAVLSRPKGPERPGGYDQGWSLWFHQIGGTGFSVSPLKHCKPNWSVPHSVWANLIATIRNSIALRLDHGLEEREQALARAFILGDRGRIERDDIEALRRAGLGHLLAISGLHMVAFAGTLFFLVRAGLALFPRLAEEYPIKKWAALAAFLGGGLYFLISGQSIPTQRAFLMISIVFLAIMVERPALTLRNVGLAALVILVIRPESLFSPGFQMSFAAVTALIVAYEINLRYAPFSKLRDQFAFVGWFKPLYYLIGIWFTSLIATLATAPFAIYHFQQISYMGPIGNMLAIPVFTFLVMPFAVLSLCLMPFGLEGVSLYLLSTSIDMLLATAHWTSSFEPSLLRIGAIHPRALVLFCLASLLALFAGKRLKLFSFVLFALAFITAKPAQRPDIYVNSKGDVMAVRGMDEKLYAPDGRKGAFILLNWLKADGDERAPVDIRHHPTVSCDEQACSAQVKGLTVTLLKNIMALEEECQSADIIVYKRTIRRQCKHPQLILSKAELARFGAYTIYIENKKIRTERANQTRQYRIWATGG